MTWANPWAWLGLAALAVPVLIHLLTRRRARIQRFPTLRFIDVPRRVPIRPAWPRDAWLMLLRAGILLVAAAALAGPRLDTAARREAAARTLSRVIVVDTSASMLRSTPAGERAIDAARREADRLAAEAQNPVLLESAQPGRQLEGAGAWLRTQPGRREIVVVSDFQAGVVDSVHVKSVPDAIGIAFHRIDVAAGDGPLERSVASGEVETVARFTFDGDRTDVEWEARPAQASAGALVQLTDAAERGRAAAALGAALAMGAATHGSAERAIAIVYAGYENRPVLFGTARRLNAPWMSDLVERVARDAAVIGIAGSDEPADRGLDPIRMVRDTAPIARTGLASVGRAVVEGRERLVFFANVEAGTLADAALIAAILRASDSGPPVMELEPMRVLHDAFAAWQRAASADELAAPDDGASDARWLWVAVLVLLALETWVRRRPASQPTTAGPPALDERGLA